ncbi:MAG: mechanosensitive ion channel family protein [Actinobacteria bacterium]|nr:mechanosensitive ion channel family protein [Actinomycetota bacterium]
MTALRSALEVGPLPSSTTSPGAGILDEDAPETTREAFDLMLETLQALGAAIVARVPLIAIALVIVVIGVVVGGWVARTTTRGMRRTNADAMVVSLTSRLVRIAVVVAFLLLALSVTGISVGALLASLGIAGLALAFALQNILENFVSGILLLSRKPFRAGDQIRIGELEGTVDDIDLRVTKLVDYNGELLLIPNADVFRSTLVNRTRRGMRRTVVEVGIDYRDDHDRAREVILRAVQGVDGVQKMPPPEVQVVAFGESSVDLEVRYWTDPHNAEVLRLRDVVLRRVKSAISEAGMTIPWPIRTVAFDGREGTGGPSEAGDIGRSGPDGRDL